LVSMMITRFVGLGKKMIEYILLAISWYVIGIVSMTMIQCWLDKQNIEQLKTWPGHKSSPNIGKQEIFVLGLCGPFILAAIAYFAILLWWITRDDKK
jgi:hypothetical protein